MPPKKKENLLLVRYTGGYDQRILSSEDLANLDLAYDSSLTFTRQETKELPEDLATKLVSHPDLNGEFSIEDELALVEESSLVEELELPLSP